MHYSARLLLIAACVAAAQDTPKVPLTPRELFYSADAEGAGKKPPLKKATTGGKTTPSGTGNGNGNGTGTGTGSVIKASMNSTAPPGIKYTVLRATPDGMVDVPADTVFHSGDRIRLSVESNAPGYLYIMSQGSSGKWTPLFPSPEIADGDNRVEARHAVELPSPQQVWRVDPPNGPEKIVMLFSRAPESGFEKLVYALAGGGTAPRKKVAQTADLPDDAVSPIFAAFQTRDLVIERYDDQTPADKSGVKKENAVYAVNISGSPDSRVVAEFTLAHQ